MVDTRLLLLFASSPLPQSSRHTWPIHDFCCSSIPIPAVVHTSHMTLTWLLLIFHPHPCRSPYITHQPCMTLLLSPSHPCRCHYITHDPCMTSVTVLIPFLTAVLHHMWSTHGFWCCSPLHPCRNPYITHDPSITFVAVHTLIPVTAQSLWHTWPVHHICDCPHPFPYYNPTSHMINTWLLVLFISSSLRESLHHTWPIHDFCCCPHSNPCHSTVFIVHMTHISHLLLSSSISLLQSYIMRDQYMTFGVVRLFITVGVLTSHMTHTWLLLLSTSPIEPNRLCKLKDQSAPCFVPSIIFAAVHNWGQVLCYFYIN